MQTFPLIFLISKIEKISEQNKSDIINLSDINLRNCFKIFILNSNQLKGNPTLQVFHLSLKMDGDSKILGMHLLCMQLDVVQ